MNFSDVRTFSVFGTPGSRLLSGNVATAGVVWKRYMAMRGEFVGEAERKLGWTEIAIILLLRSSSLPHCTDPSSSQPTDLSPSNQFPHSHYSP